MTRREQLNVAGCSCRRLRHRSYFATLISSRRGLFTVAPSSSLYIEYLACPPPPLVPFETSVPSCLWLWRLALSSNDVCILHLYRDNFYAFLRSAKDCNDVLRPRTYARAIVREYPRFLLKNGYNSLIKSHDPIPPFRILRWYVQRFIVCRNGRVDRLAGPRSVQSEGASH